MNHKGIAVIVCVLALLSLTLVPAGSVSASPAELDDILMYPETDEITLSAGSTEDFTLIITNKLIHGEENLTDDRGISLTFENANGISTSVSDYEHVMEAGSYQTVIVTITADKYASTGSYTLHAFLTIISLDPAEAGSTEVTKVDVLTVNVTSYLSSGDSYNKIIGLFENPLPDPLNTPVVTSILSFIIYVLIGALLVSIALPVVTRVIFHNTKRENQSLNRSFRLSMYLIVILYATEQSLRVAGAGEEIVGTVDTWFSIFYVILGMIVAWRFFQVIIHSLLKKIDKNLGISPEEEGADDLEPLFLLVGKLLIWVVACAMILAALGFNMTAIITSAGIVSLGITLGAQNILSQFFSGISLLATRPFKKGDLIKVGTDTTVLRVYKVGIMNTVFENWSNDEFITMPNNSVTAASIVNMTGDGLPYKISVDMSIAYGEDVDRAKELMMDIVMSHPRVITDGCMQLPYVRVVDLGPSDIDLRIWCFVDDFNDNGMIQAQLRENMYKKFIEENIKIPFPQMDVHLSYADKE